MTTYQPSSSSSTTSATLIQHVNSLLTSQADLTTALPYLHPYAPATPKGKGKAPVSSAAQHLELLAQLRSTIEGAKTVLHNASVREDERTKLVRAFKDVSTHQLGLTPTNASIASLRSVETDFPSRLTRLSPIDLLRSLSASIEIQFYLEESQFGLLKTSLTLAGACFVVDLDLETDAVSGNEEDDEMDLDARSEATGQQEREGKGKMRLSKISSSHVRGDITAKSEWIAKVVKCALEDYLQVWNEDVKGWEGQVELEKRVRRLETELRTLKELDAVAEASGARDEDGVDWFEELDIVARKIVKLDEGSVVTRSSTPSIYPGFCLSSGTKARGVNLRLRPLASGEMVPVPPGMSDDIEEQWLKGNWVLEYVKASDVEESLVVRQTWLLEKPREGETSWDGLFRVEHLLYRQASGSANADNGGMSFPYTTDFVHASSNESGLEQRWAMAEPGPEAFVVGRVGLPRSSAGFETLLELLRTQLILNQMFTSVFQPNSVDKAGEGDSEVADLDELSLPPRAVAITASLHQRSIRLSFALDEEVTLSLVLVPTPASPFVEIRWSASGPLPDDRAARVEQGVQLAKEQGTDAVALVRVVLEHCH